MELKQRVMRGLELLSSPKSAFRQMEERTFEQVLEDYIKLLLWSGFFAGIASFLQKVGFAAYLYVFKSLRIDFLRLMNYSGGTSTSIFFIYLFIGMFGLFLVSVLAKLFFNRIKYTQLISIIMYSATPILLFSWIYTAVTLAYLLWSAFLFSAGVKSALARKKN
jgi:hypothetical protein